MNYFFSQAVQFPFSDAILSRDIDALRNNFSLEFDLRLIDAFEGNENVVEDNNADVVRDGRRRLLAVGVGDESTDCVGYLRANFQLLLKTNLVMKYSNI
jgi:hypothetical protein